MAPSTVEPFKPGDELSFGKAFRTARSAGVENFVWRGTLFNTQYKGESKEQWSSGLDKAPDAGGKQSEMKATEAGKEMGGFRSLLESVNEKLDALFSMNEAAISEQFESFGKVKEAFYNQAAQSEQLPGGGRAPEADVMRHVGGAREATRSAGLVPTLLGSMGHEVGTIVDVGKALARGSPMEFPSATGGTALTPGRYMAESAQDVVNNLIGMAQGVAEKYGLRPHQFEAPPASGVSIDYPGTPMAAAGQKIQSITDLLASRLRPGGLEPGK